MDWIDNLNEERVKSSPIRENYWKQMNTNWRSVKDQEPPKDRGFLALSGGNIISVCWTDDIDKFIPNCGCSGWEHSWPEIKITYWRPLPEAPIEQKECSTCDKPAKDRYVYHSTKCDECWEKRYDKID